MSRQKKNTHYTDYRGYKTPESQRQIMSYPHLERIHAHLSADLNLTLSEWAVADAIALRLNDKTEHWAISIEALVNDLRGTTNAASVKRIAARIVAKGVFTRTRSGQRSPYDYRLGKAAECPKECSKTNHLTKQQRRALKASQKVSEVSAPKSETRTAERYQPDSERYQPDSERYHADTTNKDNKELKKNLNTKNAGLVFEVFVSVLEKAFRETSDPETIRELLADKQNAYALAVELMERSTNPISNPAKWLQSVLRTNPSALLARNSLKPSTGLTEAQKMAKLEREHSDYQNEKGYRVKLETDLTDYPNLKTFYLVSYETYNGVNGQVVMNIDAWLRDQRPDLPGDAKALRTGAAIDLQQHIPEQIGN